MNDLRANPPQQSGGAASAASPGGVDDAPDPLHNLYRMSRTAGLGSGEYVAINNLSVVALLLGLASVLALLNPILLLFVAAAILCGVLALVQIRSSNGTQTGQVFASAGILLALVFGGTTGGKMVQQRMERQQNEKKIAEAIKQLNDRIVNRQYAQAYQTLFSDKFKKDFPEDVFVSRWEGVERSAGPIESITWGERTQFDPPRGDEDRRGQASALFKFVKSERESRLGMTFVQHDGEWMVEAISEIFDAQQERQQKQQAMPNQSPPVGPQLPSQ